MFSLCLLVKKTHKVSNKSDINVTIVYKYYRFWYGPRWKEVTELWNQKWKCKSLGYILWFGKPFKAY
jgi:hypothetical protein